MHSACGDENSKAWLAAITTLAGYDDIKSKSSLESPARPGTQGIFTIYEILWYIFILSYL